MADDALTRATTSAELATQYNSEFLLDAAYWAAVGECERGKKGDMRWPLRSDERCNEILALSCKWSSR